MLLDCARLAGSQLFSKEFRKVLWKLIGYTVLLLAIVWFILESLISTFLLPFLGPWPWVATIIIWLMGTGLFLCAGFLIAPVSALFAGIFLDGIALKTETKYYPDDSQGEELPFGESSWLAIRFTMLVIIANLVALLLVLLPGVNLIIFFLLNGYLLGREYFQFIARRFVNEGQAKKLRQANEGSIFLGGLIITGFMAIPLLNLATPIFSAIFMSHFYKRLHEKTPTHLIE